MAHFRNRRCLAKCRRRLGRAYRAQARGGSLLLAFQIGRRGSRRHRPLPDRPPTLQAFRSVLSRTRSVSTHGFHRAGGAESTRRPALRPAAALRGSLEAPRFQGGCRPVLVRRQGRRVSRLALDPRGLALPPAPQRALALERRVCLGEVGLPLEGEGTLHAWTWPSAHPRPIKFNQDDGILLDVLI